MRTRLVTTSGTSLVEILVAIVLASLLLAFILQADLAVNRSVIGWISRSGLEQVAIDVRRRLRRDLLAADSVSADQHAILSVFRDRDTVRYAVADQVLLRNGETLLPDGIEIAAFRISPLNKDVSMETFVSSARSSAGGVLTITLKRRTLATQTITIPIRSYRSRTINREYAHDVYER